MQTSVINIASESFPALPGQTVLTFRPFVEYLKKRRENAVHYIQRYLSFVIEQYELHPELITGIAFEEAGKYEWLLQLLYNTLTPVVEDEDVHYWALSLPLKPVIFYSTNALFKLVADPASCTPRQNLMLKSQEELKLDQLEFCYSLILEKCYHVSSLFRNAVVRSVQDETTKLIHYYRLDLDSRFIEIHPLNPLPDLRVDNLQSGSFVRGDILHFMEKNLPLDNFRFEGFGIIHLTEVTMQYAVENIKNIIFNHSSINEEDYYSGIINSLKTLSGNSDIEFGLLPVLQVNNKLIFKPGNYLTSFLIKVARENDIEEMAYLSMVDAYLKNPELVFYREIKPEDEAKKMHLRMLKLSGVVSYGLLPVFFHDKLAGVIEIYSKHKGVLDESVLSKLDPAIPLLAQFFKNNIDDFSNGIDHIIKEKFTSLQPSVQWKFNEAAWHYLKNNQRPGKTPEMEEIGFDGLYPLYGAIDIRNSTIQRNTALNKDLQVQFTVLLEVLEKLKQASGFGLIEEKIFLAREWLERITSPKGADQEMKLTDFLDNDITPFLLQFGQGNEQYENIMEPYFLAINEQNGIAHENRRQLEASMNMIISSVNNYLDMMKEEIQRAYPCYFEKFRTDGVEYDIYIGQSIAPEKPFSDIYLKNLRLLQLSSMTAIAKYTHALLNQLPVAVETTQLIFIHSNPIDIKFRKDEKRFDVEGAYNIRYHIIKKRIDKARIKNSRERITQPGKIALIYFTAKEAEEYIGYIRYLQGQQLLEDDLEELELEDLQGVSGLKALRIGITLTQEAVG